MRKTVPLGVLLLGLVLASAAAADVTIRMKQTDDVGSKKPKLSTSSISFNADCMATRWEGEEADRSRVIFRADKNLMWVINDSKKTYQLIDQAFVDQMAAQVAQAKAQMQAQLAAMPPEQRAQAEKMMQQYGGAMGGAASTFKLDYRKTGETRSIDGHACTKYDTYWGKDLLSYAWVAPYSSLKLQPSDAAVWEKMSKFVEKMTSSMGLTATKKDYIPMHELNGIPLLTQELTNGKITSETLVESVSRGPIAPGSFDLPAGYKQEAMEGMKHHK